MNEMTKTRKKFSKRFFSVIATLAMIMTMVVPADLFASADSEVLNPPEMTITGNSIQLNKTDITADTVVKNGDQLDMNFTWTLADGVYEVTSDNKYTFKIDLSDKLKNVSLTDQKIPGISNGVKVAEYEVKGQYLYITPLTGTTMGREGFCELNGTVNLDGDSVDNDGKFEFEFFGTSFPAYAPSMIPSLTAYKSASGKVTKVGDKYYQTFNVSVSGTVKDIENVIISDTVSAGNKTAFYTTGMPENITVNGTDVAADKITSTAGGFDVNIGTVTPGTTYTLSYSLEVDPEKAIDPATTYDSKKNSVKGKYNGKETSPSDASADVTIPSVSKTGSYNADTKEATWTITVRPGLIKDMGKDDSFTVSDTIGTYLDDTALAAVAGVVKNGDGTYTIPASAFTPNSEKTEYTLTYTTKVDDAAADSISKVTLENTADVNYPDYPDYDYNSSKGTTQTPGIVGDLIDKSFTEKTADGNLKWTVTVDVPDTEYELDADNNYYKFALTDSTTEWVNNQGTHSIDDTSMIIKGSDGIAVTTADVAKLSYSNENKYISIQFTKAFIDANKGKSFTVEYDTIPTSGNSMSYKNKATLTFTPEGWEPVTKSDDDTYTSEIAFAKSGTDNLTALGLTSADYNYPICWNIRVSSNKHTYAAGDKITVTDTLPADYSLIADNFKLYPSYDYGNQNSSVDYSSCVSAVATGNVVTFTITMSEELAAIYNAASEAYIANNITYDTNTLYLYYGTSMNDDVILDFVKGGVAVEKTNSALVSVEGSDSDTVTSKVTVTPKKDGIVNKTIDDTLTRTEDDGSVYVTYKIDVNTDKAQLGNGTDDIVLTDVIGSNLTYHADTMNIVGGTSDFDVNGKTITFTLKDKTTYTITYEVKVKQVSQTESEKLTDDEINAMYGNTIKLSGEGNDSISDKVVIDSSTFESKGGMIYNETSTYITIKGTKTWSDQYNASARPSFITVILEKTKYPVGGGTPVVTTKNEKVDIPDNDTGAWSYTFKDLVTKDADGTTYTWNIKEVDVDGYTFTGSAIKNVTSDEGTQAGTANQEIVTDVNITNDFTADETEVGNIKVTKNWADGNNASNLRPSQITITVTDESGNYTDSKVLDTSAADQSVTFEDMPLYTYTRDADDNLVRTPRKYTVTETAVNGDATLLGYYTVTEPDEFTIVPSAAAAGTGTPEKDVELTNTFDGSTTVTGTKTWSDNSDEKGLRPDSLVVTLSANGSVTNNVPVWKNTDTDVWTYTFENLPKYAVVNGTPEEIVYTVEETVPTGYTGEQLLNSFTNTLKNETTSVSGTKTWVDDSDAEGARPDSITVTLYADEVATTDTATWTNTDKDVWNYSFTNLPKYSYTKDNGVVTENEIVYIVKETAVDHYTTTYAGNDITNTYVPELTSVNGTKTWVGDTAVTRPESITVTLYADNVATADTAEWTNTDKATWNYKFENLPLKNAQGNEIVYTVKETVPTNYMMSQDGFDLTNTYNLTTVTGTKTWSDNSDEKGLRPDSLVVTLSANGSVTNNVPVWKNTDTDVWTYTFENLPKYAVVNGTPEEIVYTVEETVPTGYTGEQLLNSFTNTLKNETTSVSGTKTWVDDSDAEGARPDSITVTLYADEVATTDTATWTNTDKDVWNYSFTNLPKYSYTKDNGVVTEKEISYTVKETSVDHYTTTYAGNDITNTYVPELTSVNGTKTWVDNSNAHDLRPDAITVVLSADNVATAYEPVWTNTDKDVWNYSFTNLPKYTFAADGSQKEIVYTVSETPVESYTATQNGYNLTNTEIITHVSITKTDITGEKEVAGATLQIVDKDGVVVDKWLSTTEAHEINGQLIAGETYTLKEIGAPDGYAYASDVTFTVSKDGSVDAVTMADDITKVSISKTDITGETELAGATLQVIDKDGTVIDQWLSTTEPHEINGQLIAGETYTLKEIGAPEGYAYAADILFVVSMDGTVDTVTMIDGAAAVISKTDMTGENEVAGATLQIVDKDGIVVEEWISGTQSHQVTNKLTAGETYTLKEIGAPDGYAYAEDIQFTVNAYGTVDEPVVMKDDVTKVSITKTDITGDKEVAGATLQVIDKDGNVVDEWVSTTEAHEINGELIAGAEYTLKETNAPDGYAYAEDIKFTVSTDGSVDVVTMADDITRVLITKTNAAGDRELAGATLQLADAEGNIIDEWVTGTEAHEINGVLIAGATYILHEVSAPDGYLVAEDITFTANMDGIVKVVAMIDEEDTSSESSSESSSEASSESSSESSSDTDSSSSTDTSSKSDSSSKTSSSHSESTSTQTSSTPNTGMKTGAFVTGIVALAALTVFKRKNDKNK